MKVVLKILSNTITFLLFATLLLLAFFVLSSKASGGEPQAFGYQIKSVLSGSMEPTFQTGSVIAVKPLNGEENISLKKGDIITFQEDENKLITHRIVKAVNQNGHVMYETKGDNNSGPDQQLVLADNVVAKYEGFNVPYVGYFINYASSQKGAALLMIVPGVLLIIYAGYLILTALREVDKNSKNAEPESKIV
ncbi:MAG: signal peptidase I SipW [Peribacillus sp.]